MPNSETSTSASLQNANNRNQGLPVLYSFRRCPYAMRARLALMHCGAQCELREVVLKDKPTQLLDVSSNGTVPVLVLPAKNNNTTTPVANNDNVTTNYRVIDESIDIMHWAMNENPGRHIQHSNEWLVSETMSCDDINSLIGQNDFDFKSKLDKYKYSDRHPEHSQDYYFHQAIPFLEKLEGILCASSFLSGNQFRFADAAILPFIRQFSMVDPKQFNALRLPKLQLWLAQGLESHLFTSVMNKFEPWRADSCDKPIVFGK